MRDFDYHKIMISFVIPCFNEEKLINIFYNELISQIFVQNIDYEVIFVDDGSSDNTLDEIKKLRHSDERIKFISFSRNFGKDMAVFAGLESAKGDAVVLMDVDLQDPLCLIPEFYNAVFEEGYDCAVATRNSRKGEPPIRSFCSKIFYKISRNIFKMNLFDGIRDYRMMKRNVVDELLKLKEKQRFLKGIFSWAGFKTKYISYDYLPRVHGKSKWSFSDLFVYALCIIISSSRVPAFSLFKIGLWLFAFSVFVCIAAYLNLGLFNHILSPTVLLCIILFVTSLQLLGLGALITYATLIYGEYQDRPLYLIRERS